MTLWDKVIVGKEGKEGIISDAGMLPVPLDHTQLWDILYMISVPHLWKLNSLVLVFLPMCWLENRKYGIAESADDRSH